MQPGRAIRPSVAPLTAAGVGQMLRRGSPPGGSGVRRGVPRGGRWQPVLAQRAGQRARGRRRATDRRGPRPCARCARPRCRERSCCGSGGCRRCAGARHRRRRTRARPSTWAARRLAGLDEATRRPRLDASPPARSCAQSCRWASCTRSCARPCTASSGPASARAGTPAPPSCCRPAARSPSAWRRICLPTGRGSERIGRRRCAERRAARWSAARPTSPCATSTVRSPSRPRTNERVHAARVRHRRVPRRRKVAEVERERPRGDRRSRVRRRAAEAWLLLARDHCMDRSVPGAVAVLEAALHDLAGEDAELRRPWRPSLRARASRIQHRRAPAARDRCVRAARRRRTAAERLVLCSIARAAASSGSRRGTNGRAGACAPRRRPARATTWARQHGGLPAALRALARPTGTSSPRCWSCWSPTAGPADQALRSGAPGDRLPGGRALHGGRVADAEADGRQALAVPGSRRSGAAYQLRAPCLPWSTVARWTRPRRCWRPRERVRRSRRGPHEQRLLGPGAAAARPGPAHEALDDLLEFGRRSESVELYNPAVPWRAEAALLHARLGRQRCRRRLPPSTPCTRAPGERRGCSASRPARRGLLAGGDRGPGTVGRRRPSIVGSPAPREQAESTVASARLCARAGRRAEPARRCAARRAARARAVRRRSPARGRGAARRRRRGAARARSPASTRSRRASAVSRAWPPSGLSNREIAETLFVTAKTVENHLGRTYSKLDIGRACSSPMRCVACRGFAVASYPGRKTRAGPSTTCGGPRGERAASTAADTQVQRRDRRARWSQPRPGWQKNWESGRASTPRAGLDRGARWDACPASTDVGNWEPGPPTTGARGGAVNNMTIQHKGDDRRSRFTR